MWRTRRDGQRDVIPTTTPETPGNAAARKDTEAGHDHDAAESLPNLPAPTLTDLDIPDLDESDDLPDLAQWLTTDKHATAPRSGTNKPATPASDKSVVPTIDKPAMAEGDKPATTVVRPYWRLEQQLAARWLAMAAAPGSTQALGTDECTALLPTDEVATTEARQWLKIATITASLVVAATGWWLYLGEVANFVENTRPPAMRSGDDLAQVELALQQERDNAEQRAHELATTLGALRSQAAELDDQTAQNKELLDLLKEERAKTEDLSRELAAARGQLQPRAASGNKAARNREPIELRQALQQTERELRAYKELLAQELARNRVLDEQLAAHRSATR
jgi:hypothetical protein